MYEKGHGIEAILLFFGHGTVINNFIHSFAKKLWYHESCFQESIYAVRILIQTLTITFAIREQRLEIGMYFI